MQLHGKVCKSRSIVDELTISGVWAEGNRHATLQNRFQILSLVSR